MKIEKSKLQDISGTKYTAQENGKEIGRVYLYILKNDLHEKPFALMEDLFVEEEHRGKGTGKALIHAIIDEVKIQGCYKLIATSRHGREKVHKLYKNFGFKNWGTEFRMDF